MLRLRGRLAAGLTAEGAVPELNMAPLIDMVFLLLIFFLVTTSFVREAGVSVQRPQAASARTTPQGALMIGVLADGRIFIEGRQADLRSVRGLVERFLAADPKGAVVVAADETSLTGRMIQVLDQCRLAGAHDVAVAARRKDH